MRRQLFSCAMKKNSAALNTLLPQIQNEVFVVNHARWRRRRHFPGKEKRLRIRVAERLQHFVPLKKFDIQFPKREFVIKLQPRLQISR